MKMAIHAPVHSHLIMGSSTSGVSRGGYSLRERKVWGRISLDKA
ncbi:hypothetical protein HMPREF1556_00881 [Porphyromonas sp. oral taxon 278 str. W7784]|nr:hypothetical protein HMPREF1556_00881 [Porphyromonas sp. oral taxon 278 str. W7784]